MMTLFWRRWRPVWYWPIFGVLLVLLPIATYRIMWVYEAERVLASGMNGSPSMNQRWNPPSSASVICRRSSR